MYAMILHTSMNPYTMTISRVSEKLILIAGSNMMRSAAYMNMVVMWMYSRMAAMTTKLSSISTYLLCSSLEGSLIICIVYGSEGLPLDIQL